VWVDPKRTGPGGCLWRLVAFKKVWNMNTRKLAIVRVCCHVETLTEAFSRLEDMIGDDVFELYVQVDCISYRYLVAYVHIHVVFFLTSQVIWIGM
jgi:hypothetical protein